MTIQHYKQKDNAGKDSRVVSSDVTNVLVPH
jgi:hypothetical protein